MYSNFAYIYDKLMYDVDYSKWADYIEGIIKANNLKPSLVLDLGCGTGSFCIEMARRGYEMIGVDLSPDMLLCASDKSRDEGLNIMYLNQDMTNFELYGTVDVIVCLMDSLNYVTYKKDIKKIFKLVKNYLNPGGLFIFDVNTPYKFKKVLADNIFYDIDNDITYIWENRFDSTKKVCEFDLTFFVRHGDEYKRYDEVHAERSYSILELKDLIRQSGLNLINIYDELSFSPPRNKSQRIFFVCKK